MPPTIQFANPVKFDKLTRVLRVRGVDVYVHWTVFLIAGVMLYASFRRPWVVLAGGTSWMALILLHECGHMIAAAPQACSSIEHRTLSYSRFLPFRNALVKV
jgi:hypothetical protein